MSTTLRHRPSALSSRFIADWFRPACRGAALCLLAATAMAAPAAPRPPVLQAATETGTPGEVEPPAAAVDAMLKAADPADVALLRQCLRESGIPAQRRASLFLWTPLPATSSHEQVYFMRPAREPYCVAFYGAHVFRFWLMVERSGQPYQVRHAGAGDAFEAQANLSHGRHDIAETNCTASGCATRWYRFNGVRYHAYRCTQTSDDGRNGEKTRDYRCR